MSLQRVKVTVTFFTDVDPSDYIDEDLDEDDQETPSVSEAIQQFKENLDDGTEDLAEVIGNCLGDPGFTIEVVAEDK